jgi:hypothetical protein
MQPVAFQTAPVNPHAPAIETVQEIDSRIRNTFMVLERVAKGIVAGHIRAAIVSGATGCGKTHTLETYLSRAQDDGLIEYQSVRGTMSGICLYKKLYECSNEGQILVIDDCDRIFEDLDALNILKASLDTSKRRKVHWNKQSRDLENEGVPNMFEFNGAVVFITNIDFSSEIEAEKKMTPHYKALMSRCLYFDLGIHSKREVLVRIGQVIFDDKFLAEHDITRGQAKEMIRWLTENLSKIRVLSIRSILQLISLVKTDPDWHVMAHTCMLKSR